MISSNIGEKRLTARNTSITNFCDKFDKPFNFLIKVIA